MSLESSPLSTKQQNPGWTIQDLSQDVPALYKWAQLSLQSRDYEKALACYLQLFQLQQQAPLSSNPQGRLSSLTRLQHDLEQLEFLSARGLLPAEAPQWIKNLRFLLMALRMQQVPAGLFSLNDELLAQLPFYNKALHVYRPGRLPGPALNPDIDFEKIDHEFIHHRPIQIADNFLSSEALRELRRFCDESMFWFDLHRDEFLGAHFCRGFVCGLLFQIAEELQQKLPRTIGAESLYAAWAFRCGAGPQGVSAHTDDGKVSVNFWITPDSANLDPDSGGLVLYEAETPQVWTMRDWYGNQKLLHDFMDQNQDKKFRLPYRENRAAIFASRQVHHSDRFAFREGYENRRTNIALLFGEAHRGP